jgi:uncharacterized damage-inducible protein DinB
MESDHLHITSTYRRSNNSVQRTTEGGRKFSITFYEAALCGSGLNENTTGVKMKLTEFFKAEINREVERSRRALSEVPADKYDWKPHDKSMVFGYLADMVATIPTWITMEIKQDELDVAPEADRKTKQEPKKTSDALVQALDESAAAARAALDETTDEHLLTSWQLLARGNVVMEAPRYVMIQDTINHWAHHRGQMTVYLRLMGAKVPALYGPSADDSRFL